MENTNTVHNERKKKLYKQINSEKLNNSIFYYINEARTSPKDFSRHLMINDDVSAQITKLSLFFKYSSITIPSLELHQNLGNSSLDLLYYIISIDDGSSYFIFSKKEKERNNLKERLKKYNLIPEKHVDLIIIGVNNVIETLSNILINSNHRKKILDSDMKYIGIASGLLPSGRICLVIDIVSSFRIYENYNRNKEIEYNYNNDISPSKYNYIRFTNVENEHNDSEKKYVKYSKNKSNNFFPKYFSSKSKIKTAKNINSVRGYYYPLDQVKHKLNFNEDNNIKLIKNIKNEDLGDLRISKQNCFSPSNKKTFIKEYYNNVYQKYRIPLSISIEKNYTKNKYGDVYPLYHKKTVYNDGSILLQPFFEE